MRIAPPPTAACGPGRPDDDVVLTTTWSDVVLTNLGCLWRRRSSRIAGERGMGRRASLRGGFHYTGQPLGIQEDCGASARAESLRTAAQPRFSRLAAALLSPRSRASLASPPRFSRLAAALLSPRSRAYLASQPRFSRRAAALLSPRSRASLALLPPFSRFTCLAASLLSPFRSASLTSQPRFSRRGLAKKMANASWLWCRISGPILTFGNNNNINGLKKKQVQQLQLRFAQFHSFRPNMCKFVLSLKVSILQNSEAWSLTLFHS